MVKDNNIKLTITNNSGIDMTYSGDWFEHGRLADGYKWPETIKNGDHETTLCYELNASLAGCSGYVQYKMADTVVTIAFSNPPNKYTNKVGVGAGGGKEVWDDMSSHEYTPFTVTLIINDVTYVFNCQCTASITNDATVTIIKHSGEENAS